MFESAAALLACAFLVVVLSYYLLLAMPRSPAPPPSARKVSVIIPAHDEAPSIRDCIDSVRAAGAAQIIVVDDGSADGTAQIARELGVRVISTAHLGKAAALNAALPKVRHALVAVVDADSTIGAQSLRVLAGVLAQPRMGAATGLIVVRNRWTLLGMWLHLEQLNNCLIREQFAKINAIAVTPGPLSLYRTAALRSIGGFRTEGFAEDVDVAVRLVRRGWRIGFDARAKAQTLMPSSMSGFIRQRMRFARGMLNVFGRHLRPGARPLDWYALPLLVFFYAQGVVGALVSVSQMASGYAAGFLSQGVYFDLSVLWYFVRWFSLLGFILWVGEVLAGSPASAFVLAGIAASVLAYLLILIALLRFDRPTWLHALAFCALFPFWFMVMIIYIICLPLGLLPQRNRWRKAR